MRGADGYEEANYFTLLILFLLILLSVLHVHANCETILVRLIGFIIITYVNFTLSKYLLLWEKCFQILETFMYGCFYTEIKRYLHFVKGRPLNMLSFSSIC